MKFSTRAVLAAAALSASSVHAFAPVKPAFGVVSPSSTTTTTQLHSTTEDAAATEPKSKKEARLQMMKSKQFHRRGFKEVRDDVEKTMETQFKSELVEDLKGSNYVIERDGVKVYLAKVRRF